MKRNEITVLCVSTALLVLVFVVLGLFGVLELSNKIDTSQLIQIIITFVLVLVTVAYVKRTADIAKATEKQADASVKMAKEMRQQRRPIVVQEIATPKGFHEILATTEKATEEITSDCFWIQNVGNSPAIELEIILLNKDKRQTQIERKTFLRAADAPIVFYPQNLINHVNTTCYLLCRYRGVLSSDEAQLWYETWLPFESVKSQRGDRIIITPGELEFCEVFEKKSY